MVIELQTEPSRIVVLYFHLYFSFFLVSWLGLWRFLLVKSLSPFPLSLSNLFCQNRTRIQQPKQSVFCSGTHVLGFHGQA